MAPGGYRVKSMLDDTDSSKAAGFDNIPPKLLKFASQELAEPVTNLINQSIRISHFPHDLEKAELSPLYKCKDDLIFINYRPVSVFDFVIETVWKGLQWSDGRTFHGVIVLIPLSIS